MDIVGGGADCGPVNPLMQMANKFSTDRSSQMDRFGGPQDQARPGLAGLRQHQRADAFDQNLADEFFRQTGAGPSVRPPQDFRQDFFRFSDMSHELERLAPGPPGAQQHFRPPPPQQMGDWSADFLRQEPGPAGPAFAPPGQFQQQVPGDFAEFDRIFEAQRQQPAGPVNWADDFARFDQHHAGPRIAEIPPEQEAEFESAFERATDVAANWEKEFVQQEAEKWVEEFAAQEAQRGPEDADARDALARTAGMLLEVVEGSQNPKFKTSRFMDFMRQLRDREVAIEGNRVVEQVKPVGGDWASEFAQKPAAGDWASEFAQKDQGGDWAGEFAAGSGGSSGLAEAERWAREFERNGEVTQTTEEAELEAEFARAFREAGRDGMWGDEFQRHLAETEGAAKEKEFDPEEFEKAYDQAFKEEDWIRDFRRNVAQMQSEQQEMDAWDGMQEEWDSYEATPYGYRLKNPQYTTYEFQFPNPFHDASDDDLRDPSKHRSLGEAILALEAAVVRNPHDAAAWHNLGLRQQENEREGAAIAALRQAVAIDPNNLDAWIALAVSYTNEGAREEMADALEKWMENHPTYSRVLARRRASGEVPDQGPARADFVTDALIECARVNPGDFDADVQIALGVLFNGRGEYEKAVDCFEAALTKRPDDYMLHNKLGATLANANNTPRAMDAYFSALQINPSYIRARYNVAIACIGMGQQKEAAEHLLTALAQQSHGVAGADVKGKGPAEPLAEAGRPANSLISDSVWETLRMTMLMMGKPDLASAVEKRDVSAFRGEFVF